MRVILISGKAQHGKDTTADILREELESQGSSVLVTHYADLLKYICKQFFGWNGEKDEIGRTLLQYVGTDVVRQKRPDFWVEFISSVLKLFPEEWDYVIIPDTRFPNEIDALIKDGFHVDYLRVFRPGFQGVLTKEQQMHPSETALDHREPDFTIVNDGTVEDLRRKIQEWIGEHYE